MVRKNSFQHNLIFLLCLICAFLSSLYFHDRFWWGPDDGYFGYIARELLAGETLHKDIKVLHTGLIYFINAAFLAISDGDLVALRYPLIALTVVQTGVAFKLTESRGILVAIAASAVAIAFSFIQFNNATPNWYSTCIALILMFIISKKNTSQSSTILLLGFIVGIIFQFRQLTGVFVAIGVTAAIFIQNSQSNSKKRYYGGQVIIALLTLVLAIYVFKTARLTALLLVGLYPLIVLLLCVHRCNLPWKRVAEITGLLTIGALISAAPLITYYVANGAVLDWLYGIFVRPLHFIELEMFDKPTFYTVPGFAIRQIINGNLSGIHGLLYWTLILLTPLILNLLVIRRLIKFDADRPVPALGVFASVFSLVSIHYETYVYLLFCVAALFIAVLMMFDRKKIQSGYAFVCIGLSSVALFSHATQPIERGYIGIATNMRFEAPLVSMPNTSIKYTQTEREMYLSILDVIHKCTKPTDSIYAFPMNPELYYLSGRDNALNFSASYIGLTSQKDVDQNLKILKSINAPALIIHDEEDTYNSTLALALFNEAKPLYKKIGTISPWAIYQRRDGDENSGCALETGNY